MADTMQFDLVSPERRLASLAVTAVQIPATEGDLTAMAGHAPLITTLRPGVVRVSGPKGDAAYVVTGGFAQITLDGTSVLAEQAMPLAEVTRADIDKLVQDAEAAAAKSAPETRATADKLVADLVALSGQVA